MTLTFDRFIELIAELNSGSKTMLRILQRSNPMKLAEFHTRAMFDISWEDERREALLEDLIERRLVEEYKGKFGVELVRLTLDGEDFLDEIDSYITNNPDMSEELKQL